MQIGFLGFGEAARAFQETLKAREPDLQFIAWDILLEDAGTATGLRGEIVRRGVKEAGLSGFRDADWIVSAVTADQSHVALEAIAPNLVQGQLVVDINSVSPGRKRDSAALVGRYGASYLDMAVMAPVTPRGHRTPVLVAGSTVEAVVPVLKRLEFDFRVIGTEPGRAAAIKMVRSLFVKGLEAITVEALLAAKASGCFEEIFSSLSESYPGLGWPDFASYEFERTLHHGKRRAAEMRESAATISELGLNGGLAEQIAETQERLGSLNIGNRKRDQLEDLVGEVLKVRLSLNPKA